MIYEMKQHLKAKHPLDKKRLFKKTPLKLPIVKRVPTNKSMYLETVKKYK